MTKIAVLGNYATQFLCKSIRQEFRSSSSEIEMYEADFRQIDFEIINKESGLYTFAPDFIIIHESMLGLRDDFYKLGPKERATFADRMTVRLNELIELVKNRLPHAKLIYPTQALENDMVFGHYYAKVETSFNFQLTKWNWELQLSCFKTPTLYLIDVNHLRLGLAEKTNPSLVVNADLHFTLQLTQVLASSVKLIIDSFGGAFKKCVILDLDNTTWGGVIGDDGVEGIQIGDLGIGKAFTRFQMWVKELKNRGIILAVCSKNNDDTAKEPFEKHPDMVLRLEDISVFVANWENKADNIRHIKSVLNIGFDSMVFLDDNPAEREIVRQNIPEIMVPELPEDPACYVEYLIGLNLFETTSFSQGDKDRTLQYQQEAERKEMSLSMTNMDDFLQSLEMIATVEHFQQNDFPRIAQLSQRSNQFNLRTKRYSEEDIIAIANNESYHTYQVRLKDKFGDYGLVSIVIIKLETDRTAHIDTWIMSCRVLKRGLEYAVLNKVVENLIVKEIDILLGEYLETPKNALVNSLLSDFGFQSDKTPGVSNLQMKDFTKHEHFITTK
jgi:FkbH-like protein